MIKRDIEKLLKKYAQEFRAVAVIGPRQSGKTTLVKMVFPKKTYVSLENTDERQFASEDPRGFLNRYKKNGAIIDEAQRVPVLFNYMQQILDETKRSGLFILTGSNNFLLQESITQSLAGRIGIIDLLPLTYNEIRNIHQQDLSTNQLLLKGSYPELYDKNKKKDFWYQSYIRTYVERDVKQLRNIDNTITFNKFLKLCAGRIGQQVNVSALSNECGVDVKTVNSWLGILQSSYIITLLQPHYENFNKRAVKTPKLYFVDTGLACTLLGIVKEAELQKSYFKGALFENYIVMECLKKKCNSGSLVGFYYWRDNKGIEVDLLMDRIGKLQPIEIKSSQTFSEDFTKPIKQWNNFSSQKGGYIIFDGDTYFVRSDGFKIMNWRKFLEDVKL
ncbi:MAG: ATP-binding protein [Sphingobacteriaceae bacterium]|nr:ATP-binding protein [Sphingobacteriaceae bacterium]